MTEVVQSVDGGSGSVGGRPLPTGTVTFLFTDVEGSTRLWQQRPDWMPRVMARHDALLGEVIEAHRGVVFRRVGDAVYAAFAVASDALNAAVAAQRALLAEPWEGEIPLRVRMALHTGAAEVREGDYVGHTLNRVARLLSAGHGGQILLADATRVLMADQFPADVGLQDMGEHRLKDLERPEHIYQVEAPDLPDEFPPLTTLTATRTNLPGQATPFIGRTEEVRRVAELLSESGVRLLTLTGPGGTGKTRLSLQVGEALLDTFGDGVFFVPLATVATPDLVPAGIASTLGLKEAAGQRLEDTLVEYARDRCMLLILDNFEHVLEAAPVVASLLSESTDLKFLVTSRSLLRLYAERSYPVQPLSIPDLHHLPPIEALPQYDAVALFIERARAAKPDFEVTNENAPAVAEICYRLDGLPLAIELAAARIRLFPPPALLGRLQNRLKFLTGGARDLPSRQQTLRGAVDWSYSLLDEAEQTLFARLSVFSGGCTLEAAERVCDPEQALEVEVLDGLASLAEKSLLRQEGEDEPRFAMLGTIRDYAQEGLEASGETEAVRRRHAEYYLAMVEEWSPSVLEPALPGNWGPMEMEQDNLRAALTWTRDRGETDLHLRLVAVMCAFWYYRAYWTEGRRWTEGALALIEPGKWTEASALAFTFAGVLAGTQGDYGLARSRMEEAIPIWRELGHAYGLGRTLSQLASFLRDQGDNAAARPMFEEALEVTREIGDPMMTALNLIGLGSIARDDGDYKTAHVQMEEALRVLEAKGKEGWSAVALINLGDLARLEGNYDQAARYYEESRAMSEATGVSMGRPPILHNLAYIAHHRGNDAEARKLFAESLSLFSEMGDRRGMAECVAGLACLIAETKPAETARLFGAATAATRALGARLSPSNEADYDHALEAVHARLDYEAFQAAWNEGEGMSLKAAADRALDDAG